jgi:hypothetical protein
VAPQWKPLPDAMGLLMQIDNMVAGIGAEIEKLTRRAEVENLKRFKEAAIKGAEGSSN